MVEPAAAITSSTQVSVLLSAEPLSAIDRAASHNDPGVRKTAATTAAPDQLAAAEAKAVEIITMASTVATGMTPADHSAAQTSATYNTTLTAISSSDVPTSKAPTSNAPTSEAPTSEAPTSDAPTSDAPTSDEDILETTRSETAKIITKAAREEIVAEAAKTAKAFTGEGAKLR